MNASAPGIPGLPMSAQSATRCWQGYFYTMMYTAMRHGERVVREVPQDWYFYDDSTRRYLVRWDDAQVPWTQAWFKAR